MNREFAKLDQAVENIVKKSFGSYKEDGNVAAINKPLLASAFNDAFSPKQIEVGYSGRWRTNTLRRMMKRFYVFPIVSICIVISS